jgi:DNA-directed RNA polymerase specialized sigma24 family protein
MGAENFGNIASLRYELVCRFAAGLTRDEEDAHDLTQQAFYIGAIRGHQQRNPSKLKTWLCTTLHRAHLPSQLKRDATMKAVRVSLLFLILPVAALLAEETNSLPTKITIDGVTYEEFR